MSRDETVPEFSTKPESVKRKECCRNCYLNVLAKRHKVKISTDRSFPENRMQFRPNQEVEAEKQKHFKDQITMKASFIFPKPVPSANNRH